MIYNRGGKELYIRGVCGKHSRLAGAPPAYLFQVGSAGVSPGYWYEWSWCLQADGGAAELLEAFTDAPATPLLADELGLAIQSANEHSKERMKS